MHRIIRPLLSALIALSLVVGGANAHAVLQKTSPADGSVVEIAPDSAQLTFNEVVRPLVMRLVAPDGTEADLTQSVPAGAQLTIPLPDLAPGTHVLSWRVVSDDGHPIPGSLVFSVGEVSGAADAAPEGSPALHGAIWLARFLMATGLVIGVGGALFAAVSRLSAAARQPIRVAAMVGLIAAVLYLGLHGLDALGLGFAGLLGPAPWVAAWNTSFGPSVAFAMAAAVLAILSMRWRGLAWPAVMLLAVSYAASGHAGAAEPRWMTRPMVFIHLVALCFWIGALLPLALSLRDGAGGLRRFSALVPYAVLLLIGSGVMLGIVQLGRDPAKWLTPYGFILAAKLALLVIIFALAGFNRWRLTGPALAGDPRAAGRMRHSIIAELVLAVLILGLTAGWRFTPPPRALAQVVPVAAAHLHSDQVMASLIVTPGRAGPVTVEIELTDADMAPVGPLAVTLGLALPERGIERFARPATPAAGQPGIWIIPDLVLPQSGRWSIDLEVRLSRFSQQRLSGELGIE